MDSLAGNTLNGEDHVIMWEIKACGVTLDILTDHFIAAGVYEKSRAAHVQLYKYCDRGKYLVCEKFNNLQQISSKVVKTPVTI